MTVRRGSGSVWLLYCWEIVWGIFKSVALMVRLFFLNHILSSRFVHIHVQTERVCASISRLCFPPNLYGPVHFWGPENRKMHIALKTGVQVLVTSGCQIGDCNQQQTYSQHHFNRKTQRPSGIWLVQTCQYPMKTSCFLCTYEGLILEYWNTVIPRYRLLYNDENMLKEAL